MNAKLSSYDPFSVFGDDNDDENDAGKIAATNKELTAGRNKNVRDPSNGALVFHEGTENSMLLFVQQMINDEVEKQNQRKNQEDTIQTTTSNLHASIERIRRIVQYVDEFCYQRHWMMHVGPDKATVLKECIEESFKSKQQQYSNNDKDSSMYVVVEVGTYCGYSLLHLAECLQRLALLQRLVDESSTEKDRMVFHIVSVDVNPKFQNIAKQIISLAGLSEYVTFVLLSSSESTRTNPNELSDQIRNVLASKCRSSIDFLFLDHNKRMYLSDLRQLEDSKLLKKGTYVAADNVYFHQILDYRTYMASQAKAKVVTTNFVQGTLEYILPNDYPSAVDSTFVDGIEISKYLKDP